MKLTSTIFGRPFFALSTSLILSASIAGQYPTIPPRGEAHFAFSGARTLVVKQLIGKLQKRATGYRLFIGAFDEDARARFLITADLREEQKASALLLTSEDHNLSLVLRSSQLNLIAATSTVLANDDHMIYNSREVVGGVIKHMKSAPRWKGKSREERLRSGEGIYRDTALAETHLSLRLVPIMSQGELVGYTGQISGTAEANARNSFNKAQAFQASFSVEIKSTR